MAVKCEFFDFIIPISNIDRVYKFKGSLKDDGSLKAIRNFEEVDDNLIPTLDEVEPIPMESIADAIGENELVHGWIGRVINIGAEPVAFEIADMSASPPLTVWFGGEYTKIPPEKVLEISNYQLGDEVCAYGYISQSSSDMRMNAVNIVKAG